MCWGYGQSLDRMAPKADDKAKGKAVLKEGRAVEVVLLLHVGRVMLSPVAAGEDTEDRGGRQLTSGC